MRFFTLLGVLHLACAQEAPKTKASDYPVHVQMDAVTLAAEYLVHSIPTAKGIIVSNDYLVVDVAFFGPPASRLKLSPDNFTLRINGRGAPLGSQPSGMVAQSGSGFPGLSPARQVEMEESAEYKIRNASLPEGEKALPQSGLIFFAHRGNLKNIHSVELFYEGPMGKSSLKLLP